MWRLMSGPSINVGAGLETHQESPVLVRERLGEYAPLDGGQRAVIPI